ncbi:MAG: hypothetical protein JWL63_2706 [Rhodocyclales bacterium]|nr:hypothetical protein [Rhodocyclales bacterium]
MDTYEHVRRDPVPQKPPVQEVKLRHFIAGIAFAIWLAVFLEFAVGPLLDALGVLTSHLFEVMQ